VHTPDCQCVCAQMLSRYPVLPHVHVLNYPIVHEHHGEHFTIVVYDARFGVIFNMGWLVYGDFKAGFELGPWWQHLFNGYSITTWMVVFNLGSTGLLVSWLMKYSDNIVKVRSLSLKSTTNCFTFIYVPYASEMNFKALYISSSCGFICSKNTNIKLLT
jgi:hypothetical protein